MAFWRHFSHLVWATKERLPLIMPEIEIELYKYITGKANGLGCTIHAIGGIEDHIHVVVSIPPRLVIADVVGQLKGSSSHHINYHIHGNSAHFAWQNSYGSLSFGETQLPKAVKYVLNQKSHHQAGTISATLERMDEEDNGPTQYKPEVYEQSKINDVIIREYENIYGAEWTF